MLLLLVPMVILYELGIVAVRLLVRPKPAADAAEQSS
jgi:Sec-independent protein secretion pathway component TatC